MFLHTPAPFRESTLVFQGKWSVTMTKAISLGVCYILSKGGAEMFADKENNLYHSLRKFPNTFQSENVFKYLQLINY